jgi:hypothetical protein
MEIYLFNKGKIIRLYGPTCMDLNDFVDHGGQGAGDFHGALFGRPRLGCVLAYASADRSFCALREG